MATWGSVCLLSLLAVVPVRAMWTESRVISCGPRRHLCWDRGGGSGALSTCALTGDAGPRRQGRSPDEAERPEGITVASGLPWAPAPHGSVSLGVTWPLIWWGTRTRELCLVAAILLLVCVPQEGSTPSLCQGAEKNRRLKVFSRIKQKLKVR